MRATRVPATPSDMGQPGCGYQPMLVAWAKMDVVLADEFRDGNVPAMMAPLTVAKRGRRGDRRCRRRRRATAIAAIRPATRRNCWLGCGFVAGATGAVAFPDLQHGSPSPCIAHRPASPIALHRPSPYGRKRCDCCRSLHEVAGLRHAYRRIFLDQL
ncbi:MAG: hypothetical protein ACYDC6_06845 [Acidobacteriaceae bacterium]